MKINWQIKKLGEIFEITSSKRVFRHEWTNEGIPFFRAREVVNLAAGKKFKAPIFISVEMYENYSSRYGVPKEGDILVTGVGTLGICYLVKKGDKFYFKDGNIIWFKKNSNVDSRYVEYFFQSNQLKNEIKSKANGATVGTFTIKTAKETEIPLPPLETQKEVVAKLDEKFAKLHEAKKLREEALLDAEKILFQTLREIFEEGKKEGWEEKRIGDIFVLNYGKGLSRFERSNDANYVVYGANGELGKSDKFLIEGESIIVGRKGSAGEVIRASGRIWPTDVTYFVTEDKKYDIDFAFYLFKYLDFTKYAKGVKPGINRNEIYSLKFNFPNILEQQQIVTKLNKLSKKTKTLRELHKSQLEDLKLLEKAYLKDAFKGELK